MATGNKYQKFREVWTVVFELSEQTDRHTHKDMHIAVFCTPTGAEVITILKPNLNKY